MNKSQDASLLVVQQQIARLEQEYQLALHQDKDFGRLKSIKMRLRSLEDKFRELVSTR